MAQQKYVICKFNETKFDQVNAWFHHCMRNQVPYVYIKKSKSKYAEVHWDYANFGEEATEKLKQLSAPIKAGLRIIYETLFGVP
jgi:fructose/tagatose bisphosphate aldolase